MIAAEVQHEYATSIEISACPLAMEICIFYQDIVVDLVGN